MKRFEEKIQSQPLYDLYEKVTIDGFKTRINRRYYNPDKDEWLYELDDVRSFVYQGQLRSIDD